MCVPFYGGCDVIVGKMTLGGGDGLENSVFAYTHWQYARPTANNAGPLVVAPYL